MARRLAAGLRNRGVGPAMWSRSSCRTGWRPRRRSGRRRSLARSWCRSCTSTAARNSSHILATARPKVFVTAEQFGRMTFQPDLARDVPIVGVVGGSASRGCNASTICSPTNPWPARSHTDPADPGADRVHVRHDPRSEGRHPQPSDAGLRDPSAAAELPAGPRQAAHRHAGRPLHRHDRRVPDPGARGRADRPVRCLGSRARCSRR